MWQQYYDWVVNNLPTIHFVVMVICLVGYTFKVGQRISSDKAHPERSYGRLTYGDIVVYVIVSVVPIVNCFALVFDLMDSILGSIKAVMNKPVVPKA
jgi:hypothetical protein